jgi:hypothetical protein
VVAAQLHHPVHHQEVEVEVEELGAGLPHLPEEGVERLLVGAEHVVALGEAHVVLRDVRGQRGDGEVERGGERLVLDHPHVGVVERGQGHLRAELLQQAVDQHIGDDVEEVLVLLAAGHDDAALGEQGHDLLPLALVAAERERELPVQLVGVRDAAALQQGRRGPAGRAPAAA